MIENNFFSIENLKLSLKYFLITTILSIISIALFIGVNLQKDPMSWEIMRNWGGPSILDIYEGDYWGLITTNFLHTAIWHIYFNLTWFWHFGRKIEINSNRFYYFFIIISSAFVCSIAQISFSNASGIGLSGIVYAFFGYIFIQTKISNRYDNFIDKRTINYFIIWLFACIAITYFKILPIGNAAHFSGFIWGMLIAYLSKFSKIIQIIIFSILLSLCTVSLFYNPWSVVLLSKDALKKHQEGNLKEAAIIYKKILNLDEENEFAKNNLGIILADSLKK